jgi:hypothetical protein
MFQQRKRGKRHPQSRLRLFLYVLAAVTLGSVAAHWPAIVQAADGDLDPSFNSNGKVVTTGFSGFEAAYDVAKQPDDKLVVVGEGDGRFVVARYRDRPKISA